MMDEQKVKEFYEKLDEQKVKEFYEKHKDMTEEELLQELAEHLLKTRPELAEKLLKENQNAKTNDAD
jgi:hypothetical protein